MVKSVTTAPYKPEQTEQAEVIGKRKIKGHDATGDPETKSLVTFKLSDGSVKEFLTSAGGKVYYDSFHEGETGILTYEESPAVICQAPKRRKFEKIKGYPPQEVVKMAHSPKPCPFGFEKTGRSFWRRRSTPVYTGGCPSAAGRPTEPVFWQ
jgi:hypothetical protein